MSSSDLVSRFRFERLLRQDEAGRRISLLGNIDSQPSILIAERAAFSSDPRILDSFTQSLTTTSDLGTNDIYNWFLARSSSSTSTTSSSSNNAASIAEKDTQTESSPPQPPPDLKLTLIHPCDAKHIQKYTPQTHRTVIETSAIYHKHIAPWIDAQVAAGRTDWVLNILQGRKEQGSVLHKNGVSGDATGWILLPDLKWDKTTLSALDLLVVVQRTDLRSLRDLRRRDVEWLRSVVSDVQRVVERLYGSASAACGRDGEGVDGDMLKFFVHYHPTYYHFHIHVTHTALEPSATQAVGKAISVHSLISQLESLPGGQDASLADVDIEYTLGEESELWKKVFGPLKRGEEPEV